VQGFHLRFSEGGDGPPLGEGKLVNKGGGMARDPDVTIKHDTFFVRKMFKNNRCCLDDATRSTI
jgi:hypothetical protein